MKVKNVMIKKRQVITISPDTTVEFAAGMLTENDIGCLPVLEGDKVVGMITTIDLLRPYQLMLGLPTPGIALRLACLHAGKTILNWLSSFEPLAKKNGAFWVSVLFPPPTGRIVI